MTHIFDIDGTIVEFHTNKWLIGAKEKIVEFSRRGDQIIFVTMRGMQDTGTEWSIEKTKQTILKELDNLGVKYEIFFGATSPRCVYDDSGITLFKRQTNQPWL